MIKFRSVYADKNANSSERLDKVVYNFNNIKISFSKGHYWSLENEPVKSKMRNIVELKELEKWDLK